MGQQVDCHVDGEHALPASGMKRIAVSVTLWKYMDAMACGFLWL